LSMPMPLMLDPVGTDMSLKCLLHRPWVSEAGAPRGHLLQADIAYHQLARLRHSGAFFLSKAPAQYRFTVASESPK